MSTSGSQEKRKLPPSPDVSPSNEMVSKMQKLPGETCKHCNKLCSKKGTSLQCEVCYSWVHASCEGVSNNNYKRLCASMPNIVYYCSLNQCYACLSQLTSVVNTPLTESVDDHNFQTIIDNHNTLENSVSKLGIMIEALSKANTALEKRFSDLLNTQSVNQKILKPSEVSTAATASSIADGLSECERKKNNIIVYNLPEAPKQSSEEQSFADLCKHIVKVDLKIQKIFRIGRKDSNRIRPLLVCFTSEETKLTVLSSAPRLCFHDDYKKVCISPDMTKFERVKHKKLVEELKQRRQQGKTNLTIKNGTITHRQLRRSNANMSISAPTPAQPSQLTQASSTVMSTGGGNQDS